MLDDRWATIIEKERLESQLTPPPPHEQFLTDIKHDVTNIKHHIECLKTQSEKQIPPAEYQTESNFQHNFLYETEMLRLGDLRLRKCEDIRELFENYMKEALKFYMPKSRKSDLLGVSCMLLTLLKLICALDEKATLKFPLLEEHKLGINPILIQSLLLPLKSDMELAAELEEYLSRRQSPTLPSLIEETDISERSYSVRHSQRTQHMQECKRSLLEMGSKTEAERIEEVKRSRERYNALSEEISKLQCCTHSTYYSPACTKCQKTSKREQIRGSFYMRSLPAEEHYRDAVVFELLAPIEIVSVRDCLYLLKSRIFGFIETPPEEYAPSEHLRVLEFYRQRNVEAYLKINLEETTQKNKFSMDFKNFLNISQRMTEFSSDYIRDDGAYNGEDKNDNFNEFTCSGQKFFRLGNNFKFIWERCLVDGRIDESISEYCKFNIESEISTRTNLLWALDQTINTQNVALCEECPHNMSPAEFREFGTFRAGNRLQLRNLYRALEQRTLPLKSRAVLALTLQSLWQAGPPLSCLETTIEDRKWIRDAHVDLLCLHFTSKLIDLCISVIERYSKDWTAHTVLLAIEAVLSRIVSLNPDVPIRFHAIRAQIQCLRTSCDWTNQLKSRLEKSHSHELYNEESKRFCIHLVEACCCEIFCFYHDSESLALLFSELGSGKFI